MSSYRIVQTPDGKHWVIVSPEDDGLLWCGSHWGYVDQDAPLIRFRDYEAATHYARTVLGDGGK